MRAYWSTKWGNVLNQLKDGPYTSKNQHKRSKNNHKPKKNMHNQLKRANIQPHMQETLMEDWLSNQKHKNMHTS